MAYYDGIYICGHEGSVKIFGPLSDIEWKKERAFERLCPECYQKQKEEKREQEYKEAAEKAAAMGLPELIGTEKQVPYAVVLRNRIINRYERKMEDWDEDSNEEGEPDENLYDADEPDEELPVYVNTMELVRVTKEELADAMNYMLFFEANAGFWINRCIGDNTFKHIIQTYRDYKIRKSDDFDEINKELRIKLTAVPKCGNKKPGTVELNYQNENKVILATYIRDYDFVRIVKGLYYRRGGCTWYKDITEYTGPIDDCAAELGNRLLMAGFTVRFMTEKSKQAALSGTFTPENDRWIKYNSELSGLSLIWHTPDNELFHKALKLPGAQRKRGIVSVKMEFYREVQDFAEVNGFSISCMAQKKIEKYIETEKHLMDGHGENSERDKISD